MSAETTQQELVWVSPEEYNSSVDGEKEMMQVDGGDVDIPSLQIVNGMCVTINLCINAI